jgi:hypothetical protein
MDKSQLLAIFNKQFKEFVDDFARVFPNNKDISLIKMSIGSLLMIKPSIVYKGYKKFVVDIYRDYLEAGDINFFIDKDYKSDLHTIEESSQFSELKKLGPSSDIMLEKIDALRGPVREMTEKEQANVIKYMQNMLKLSDLYEAAS